MNPLDKKQEHTNRESMDEPIDDTEDTSEWTVSAEESGERLDKYLAGQFGQDVSRTQIQLWIKQGHILLNEKMVKPNQRLAAGDHLIFTAPEPELTDIVPEPISLDIVYEDRDVIVINKPRGVVVHPAPGHLTGTVVNALLYHCRDLSGINGKLRPGIVHRIDKDTSGLLMAAKNDQAHLSLAAQLKDHSVIRKYTAFVHGYVPHDRGTIDAPIGRDPHDRKMFTVTETNSKQAVTHFAVLERFNDYTYVELQLETGRTHQIRVHMKYIGHPLVGDPMYGRAHKGLAIDGQALHAGTLGFVHPSTRALLQFERPIPVDMHRLLQQLRSR